MKADIKSVIPDKPFNSPEMSEKGYYVVFRT